MRKISEDANEGLALSLAIYVAAIGVTIAVLAVPVYFIIKPTKLENVGMAAYQAPPGTRLIPEIKPRDDVAFDWRDHSPAELAKLARR
jgi:hypothetical protein